MLGHLRKIETDCRADDSSNLCGQICHSLLPSRDLTGTSGNTKLTRQFSARNSWRRISASCNQHVRTADVVPAVTANMRMVCSPGTGPFACVSVHISIPFAGMSRVPMVSRQVGRWSNDRAVMADDHMTTGTRHAKEASANSSNSRGPHQGLTLNPGVGLRTRLGPALSLSSGDREFLTMEISRQWVTNQLSPRLITVLTCRNHRNRTPCTYPGAYPDTSTRSWPHNCGEAATMTTRSRRSSRQTPRTPQISQRAEQREFLSRCRDAAVPSVVVTDTTLVRQVLQHAPSSISRGIHRASQRARVGFRARRVPPHAGLLRRSRPPQSPHRSCGARPKPIEAYRFGAGPRP